MFELSAYDVTFESIDVILNQGQALRWPFNSTSMQIKSCNIKFCIRTSSFSDAFISALVVILSFPSSSNIDVTTGANSVAKHASWHAIFWSAWWRFWHRMCTDYFCVTDLLYCDILTIDLVISWEKHCWTLSFKVQFLSNVKWLIHMHHSASLKLITMFINLPTACCSESGVSILIGSTCLIRWHR